MHDVLLVDDERYVLDTLVNALDWMEYGFARVHTAQSAGDALAIMRQHPIDLLLSDIMMPGVNGLEMLRAVRAQYPNTHCILISAHSKFEFAKEALRMGVENYLLKPIDINELRETVQLTAENIRNTVTITDDLFRKNILERWLYGRITMDELVEHSRYAKLNVLMRQYRVLLARTQDGPAQALAHMAQGLGLDDACYALTPDAHTGILLVGGRDVDMETLRAAADGFATQSPGALLAFGSLATGHGEVAQSLADAGQALRFALLSNAHGQVAFDDIGWDCLPGEALSALDSALHMPAPEAAVRAWLAQTLAPDARPEDLRALYAHACLALPRMVAEQVYTDAQLSFAPFLPPYTHARLVELLSAAVAALGEYVQQSVKGLSPITQRVVQYIAENITAAVSIKQFCEQAHMNAAYIGRLFKEETGMYFSDYVYALRINRAKALLRTTDLPVSAIARQVGMYDVSYFTQRFKKQERVSPSKYRQLLAGEGARHTTGP